MVDVTARPVLGVDLDDVCADRLGELAAVPADGIDVCGRVPRTWDLRDWGVRDQDHYDRLHSRAFIDRPGDRTVRPVSGAVAALRQLHAAGYVIRIASGRLWSPAMVARAVGDTAIWLDTHRIPADDIAFVTGKTAVRADIFIEDAPHFVAQLRTRRQRVNVFDQPYNRHFDGPRAADWTELIQLSAVTGP